MPSDVMLSVVMLSVVMLSVIGPRVVAPNNRKIASAISSWLFHHQKQLQKLRFIFTFHRLAP